MSKKNCGHKTPCGCGDTPLTTPAPCNEAPECVGERCSELFDANCIIYKGLPLACDDEVIVPDCTRVDVALANIVQKICSLEDPDINVYSNSIFVDAKYGNDATGEYGNFAKPFKTIVAAQIAAVNYMNANPYQYDSMGTMKYNNSLGETNVAVEHFPRISIKVAPGIYKAEDEFQFAIDNPDLLGVENNEIDGVNWDPVAAKGNASWNLLLNFVDYYLNEGTVLVDYGFDPYSTTSWLMGFNDYNYELNPISTNIYGNGNILTNKGVAVYWQFFQLGLYIERFCNLKINCNTLIMQGYIYGGTLEINVNTLISIPVVGGFPSDSGTYDFYFDYGLEDDIPSSITCKKYIQCYTQTDFDNLFSSKSIFWVGDHNVTFNCETYLGRNLDNLNNVAPITPSFCGNTSIVREFRSADNAIGWIENFFTNNAQDPALGVSTYIDNYGCGAKYVNINIDYLKTSTQVLGVRNRRVIGEKFDIREPLTVTYRNKLTDFFVRENNNDVISSSGLSMFQMFGFSNTINPNAVLDIETNKVVIKSVNNDADIRNFFIFFLDANTYGFINVRNSRFKILNTLNDTTNSVCFAGKPDNLISPTPISLLLSNVIFESVNQLNTDSFINVDGQTLDLRLYQNCYSNVPVSLGSTVTNLIPGTSLVIDNNVIAE